MGESMACEECLTHKEEQLFSSCKITGTNTNQITDREETNTISTPSKYSSHFQLSFCKEKKSSFKKLEMLAKLKRSRKAVFSSFIPHIWYV